MPIYEFKCEGCGQVTDDLFASSCVPGLIECRHCGESAKKIISQCAVVSHLSGTHPPVTDKMRNTARHHEQSYFSKPEIKAQFESGELQLQQPKGMPAELAPAFTKEKRLH